MDLISFPNYHNYLKLMVDGVVARPFSATTCLSISCGSCSEREQTAP